MVVSTEGWDWPFSLPELIAGLRRHLSDTSVIVTKVDSLAMPDRQPAIGYLRALRVEYETSDGQGIINLVVKEPRGTTRTGLAGAGRREVGVYQTLAEDFPMATPKLISASAVGHWLILESFVSVRSPSSWTAGDYSQAIEALTRLHDRFWDLGKDLTAFPWLSKPLGADFEIHITAAANAIERIVYQGLPAPLVEAHEPLQMLANLTMHADQIILPLQQQPPTFLHGDYWPGNIAIRSDGSQIVYDWQLAGVGPGILDLLVFTNKSMWHFNSLPVDPQEIIANYREGMLKLSGVSWDESEWAMLWDHALMWRFLQEWVDLLAASPGSLLETRAEQLTSVWFDPVAAAVSRRLVAE
jgi:hypothetical protein